MKFFIPALLLFSVLVSASSCGDLVCQDLEKVVCPSDCPSVQPAPVPQSFDGAWLSVLILVFFVVIVSIGWFLSTYSANAAESSILAKEGNESALGISGKLAHAKNAFRKRLSKR